MDFSQLSGRLSFEMKSLFSLLDEDNITAASNKASMELGWSLPIDDTLKEKCFWYGERTRRHCIDFLCTEAAYKFDYKQAKLSDRFEQLNILVEKMDKAFEKAVTDNPTLFTNTNPLGMFGTYISSGFQDDAYGRNTTYEDSNEVKVAGIK